MGKNMKSKFWLVLLVIPVVIAVGIIMVRQLIGKENISFKVGLMVPLSGEVASYGISVKRGVELAIRDFKDVNVDLVVLDTKCDPEEIEEAMKTFSNEGVVGVVGEICSGATIEAVPLAESFELVLVSPGSTSSGLSGISPWFFRTIPSDDLQGDFLAKKILDAENKELAVLYTNESYGLGFMKVFQRVFIKNGGTIVSAIPFERGKVDFSEEVAKMKALKPEAILIISNSPISAAEALIEIDKQKIETSLWGSEGLFGETFLNNSGISSEGLKISAVSLGSEEYLNLYKSTYGSIPETYSAQAYDAMSTIIYGVINSGSTDPKILRDTIKDFEFEGVSGEIKFDDMGDVLENYIMAEVKNGMFLPM